MKQEKVNRNSRSIFHLLGAYVLLQSTAFTVLNTNLWESMGMINQSFATEVENHHGEHPKIDINTLVQELDGSLLPIDEKSKKIEIAVEGLKGFFSDRTDEIVERMIKDNTPLLQVMQLSDVADKINYHSPSLTSLRIKAFDVLVGHVRDHDQSKTMLGHLKGDMAHNPQLSKEDEIIYNTTQFLYSLVFSPDYENGIVFGKRTLELIEAEVEMYEEKIRLYANLLQYCCLTGQLEEGREYVTKGELCFPKSQSRAYNALYIFAVSLYHNDCGNYDKSMELISSNQSLFEIQDSYPSIRFFVLLQLAEAFGKKGEVEEGLKTLLQAEKLGRDYYANEDNSFFGKLYLLKALCLISDPEQFANAQESLDKALPIFEKIYLGSDKHRNQAFTHLLMGKLHYLLKQEHQAKHHFAISEEIYNKLFKNKNTEDVKELHRWLENVRKD